MTESEKGIIGCVLYDPDCISGIYDLIKPEMFSDDFGREAYRSMLGMYDTGKTVNIISLTNALEDCITDQQDINKILIDIVAGCPSSAYARTYADNIVREWKVREVKKIFAVVKLLPNSIDDTIGTLSQRMDELKSGKESQGKTMAELVTEYKDKYFIDAARDVVYTGFQKLDECTGGFERGGIVVIGARPSVGKSAIAEQMVIYMARQGKKVAYFSLEMSNKQHYERAVAAESGIDMNRIRKATRFLDDEPLKFQEGNERLNLQSLHIYASSYSVGQIRNICRNQQFDCIVVDYLQLIDSEKQRDNRAAEVAEISRKMKMIATTLNVPVILLSQINRSSMQRADAEPTMAELRESGAIEQDADIILLMWHPSDKEQLKEYVSIKVEKNKQGNLMHEGLLFDGGTMKFSESQKSYDEFINDVKALDKAEKTDDKPPWES